MEQIIVNSIGSLSKAIEGLTELFNKDHYVHVRMNSNKRTLSQDALVHCWYADIGKEEGNEPEDVKSYCKYHYGISMLSEDPDLTEYVNMIRDKIRPMGYEDRIKFMKYIKVTSLMSTAVHAAYMVKLQLFYGQQGLKLQSKGDI